MGLNIVDARITPLDGGLGLDTYLVLEDTGTPIADRHRAQQIEQQLRRVLQSPEADLPVVTRRAPRQVRMFSTPTQITFSEDPLQNRTVLEIIAGDRPGLLSEIGKVFLAEQIDVVTAKIMTIGERAEDVFYVTDGTGQAAGRPARQRLQEQPARRARPARRGKAARVAGSLSIRYPRSSLESAPRAAAPLPVRAAACAARRRRRRPADLRHVPLSIGEPRHAPPPFIAQALVAGLRTLGSYPVTLGLAPLREAIARWLERRFALPAGAVSPETMVLPVNGTREALFAFVQAAVDSESARARSGRSC